MIPEPGTIDLTIIALGQGSPRLSECRKAP
jgi:hypothetical protein